MEGALEEVALGRLGHAAVAVQIPGLTPERAETLLHGMSVPVIARVSRDGLLFSARTLFEGEPEEVAEAVRTLYATTAGRRV